MTRLVPLAALVAALVVALGAPADSPPKHHRPLRALKTDDFTAVEFPAGIKGDRDVSAAAAYRDLLVIGSDEMEGGPAVVQVLKKAAANRYELVRDVVIDPSGKDVDIEGVAASRDGKIYVVGSHSAFRTRPEAGFKVEPAPGREQVFHFQLNADGTTGPVAPAASLRPALLADPVLKAFVPMAGKENGVDIEGLAVDAAGLLHFGFRGPVLRAGLVPVMSCKYDDAAAATVRYVQLDGRGVRDLVAVEGGFLVLAGPMAEHEGGFGVYFWNGTNALFGDKAARAVWLAELPEFPDEHGKSTKPEGLAVLSESPERFELLLVCDGLLRGGPRTFTLPRP